MDYTKLVELKFINEATHTALGEPQIWIYLQSGRLIEITHEEIGLPEEDQFYSVILHCSDKEFDNGHFESTCGTIECFVADGIVKVTDCVKNILKGHHEKPSKEELDFYSKYKDSLI